MNNTLEHLATLGRDTVVGDRFRLLEQRSGGAEPVFTAEDIQTGRPCSLRFIAPGPGQSARLAGEMAAAAQLKDRGDASIALASASGMLPGSSMGYVALPDMGGMKPLAAFLAGGPMPLSRAAAIGLRAALALDSLSALKMAHGALSADCIWAKGAADSEREQVFVLGPFEPLSDGAKLRSFNVLGRIFYELVSGAPPASGIALPFEFLSASSMRGAVDALAHELGKGDPSKRAALAMEVVRAQDVLSRLRPPSPSITNEASSDSFALALPEPTPPAPPSSQGAPVSARTAQVQAQKTMPSLSDGQRHAAFGMIRSYVIGLGLITVAIISGAAVRSSDWERDDIVPSAASSAKASAGAPDKEKPIQKPAASAEKEVIVGQSVAELRTALEKDMRMGNAGGFINNLEKLLDAEPSAASEREIKNGMIEVLMRIMMGDSTNADRLFGVIENKMGTNGADLLYEIMTTRGGSKAAKRSEDMLKSQEFRDKGTAELRIAYDFRMAKSCAEKEALFERAGKEGDRRVLGSMQMMNRECGGKRGGDCCFSKNPQFKAALEELKKRYPQ